MSWDFLLPSSSLIYACSMYTISFIVECLPLAVVSVSIFQSLEPILVRALPTVLQRGCLRARAHFTFGRGDALHSPLAVGSASLSTSLLSAPLVSSANATPNPIWRLALPSVDFFRRSSALDSGAAVAARRLVVVVT